jgi:hypothetical protein
LTASAALFASGFAADFFAGAVVLVLAVFAVLAVLAVLAVFTGAFAGVALAALAGAFLAVAAFVVPVAFAVAFVAGAASAAFAGAFFAGAFLAGAFFAAAVVAGAEDVALLVAGFDGLTAVFEADLPVVLEVVLEVVFEVDLEVDLVGAAFVAAAALFEAGFGALFAGVAFLATPAVTRFAAAAVLLTSLPAVVRAMGSPCASRDQCRPDPVVAVEQPGEFVRTLAARAARICLPPHADNCPRPDRDRYPCGALDDPLAHWAHRTVWTGRVAPSTAGSDLGTVRAQGCCPERRSPPSRRKSVTPRRLR